MLTCVVRAKLKLKLDHLDSQNMQVEEEEQMGETLNKYFNSVFTLETGGLDGARK